METPWPAFPRQRGFFLGFWLRPAAGPRPLGAEPLVLAG